MQNEINYSFDLKVVNKSKKEIFLFPLLLWKDTIDKNPLFGQTTALKEYLNYKT